MIDCTDCVRKTQCDLYIESKGNVNLDVCRCKYVRNDEAIEDMRNKFKRAIDILFVINNALLVTALIALISNLLCGGCF